MLYGIHLPSKMNKRIQIKSNSVLNAFWHVIHSLSIWNMNRNYIHKRVAVSKNINVVYLGPKNDLPHNHWSIKTVFSSLSLFLSLSRSLHLLFLNKTKRTLLMIWVKSTDPYLNSLFKRFILIMIIANICTMLLFYTCCYYKLTLKFSITSFIATLLFSNIGKLCYFINKQQQLADSCNTFDK